MHIVVKSIIQFFVLYQDFYIILIYSRTSQFTLARWSIRASLS